MVFNFRFNIGFILLQLSETKLFLIKLDVEGRDLTRKGKLIGGVTKLFVIPISQPIRP